MNRIKITDPRLTLLASQAALEFDNAARGKSTRFQAAEQLARFIKDSLGEPIPNPSEEYNFDVSTVDMLGQALLATPSIDKVKTVKEVVQKALEMSDSLTAEKPLESYEELRDFCVALGNSLIAQRESLEDQQIEPNLCLA